MEAAQAYRDALQRLRATVRRSPNEARRALVDQAVGLLAGRVGCRLAEARTHLIDLANEQRRELDEIAAGLIDVLDAPTSGADLIPAAAIRAALEAPPPHRSPDLDEDARHAERLRQTERLGNLGFGEWDLRTGHVEWSEQLYRIFERDPADGPMTLAEIAEISLDADLPVRAAAAEAFERGERTDVVSRVRINDQVKHLRTMADAIRDADGQPLKIFGIVQDVTHREVARSRLIQVERQLAEQRRSLDAEHRLAEQLQRIILPIPDEPFDLPGLRVALRYLPAERISKVGGDWYHAATLPDGTVLLAVGDVAGHGIRAATTMAQLRHALRALTVTTTDPPQLMSYLNRLMVDIAHERPATTATAVIARYEPATRTLTWTGAGHPAPLLAHDGVTTVLDQPTGLLLGVRADAVYTSSTVTLVPGDVLLLYTDGLVEHRRRTLKAGLARVIEDLDAAIAGSPRQPLAALLGRLRPANPDDDTCVLAVRPVVTEETPAA
jgi:serine phosphatase RsbU (regulator of sigma subunit)